MDIKLLETFIEKYNVGGLEAVKWTVNSTTKTLSVAAKTEDRNTVVYVDYTGFDAITEDMEFGVFETKKLKQRLSVFGKSVVLAVNKSGTRVSSIDFSDDEMEARFVTSDLSVVSSAPTAKALPEFEVEVLIDEKFITNYNKAKKSIPEADKFTLMNDKKGSLKLVLGFSSNNTDRVTMDVQAVDGKKTLAQPLSFQSKVLADILSVNSDSDRAILKVSDNGLSNISFEKDGFKSNYFMVAIPDTD